MENDIAINEVIAIGGVAKKSNFVMQVLSDVLAMPIKIVKSEQSVPLEAAIFAAVASGVYTSINDAQKKMGQAIEKTYEPNPQISIKYKEIYKNYEQLAHFNKTRIMPK